MEHTSGVVDVVVVRMKKVYPDHPLALQLADVAHHLLLGGLYSEHHRRRKRMALASQW